MMKFKKVIGVLLSMVVVFGAVGCGSEKQEELQKIVLGIMPSTDAFPYVIAQEQGFFEKNGVEVEIQEFTSAKDRDAAIQAGALDGMMMDLTGASLLKGNGVDIKVTSLTQGDFIITAGKEAGITDLAGLKGKAVGLSQNTLIELITDLAVKEGGLQLDEIIKEEVAATPVRMQLLMENAIDVATLPEPFALTAIAGGAVKLTSANDLGYNFGCLAFTQTAIDNKTEEIKRFNAAYDEAVKYINDTPKEEYLEIAISKIGYSEAAKDFINLPVYVETSLPSEKDLNTAIEWVKEKGLVGDEFTESDLVVERVIK